jgi:hypothetical protein
MLYKVDLNVIQDMRYELRYKSEKDFAKDCGITWVTYGSIKRTGKSWLKFLVGLDNLHEKKLGKKNLLDFYLAKE